MKSNEIRASFLKYFGDRGHKIVPSSPLIPHDDPTLLFANAGMNQFKGVFLGQEKRDYKRAASSQKCIRAGGKHNDLENVGFTARHNTFFEMMGNFSFGDYFKEEAIAFAWEYIVKVLGFDPKRLYATVYEQDDEAERLWKKIAPELGDRVRRFGEKDNFWSMGDTGPCGPCSEIHYDRGEKYTGELNGDGDRYTEVWNLVFMQYNRDESGKMTPLPKPSVDTGAGLERFSMVLQDVDTNYETDLFIPLIEKVAEISGIEYVKDKPESVSHKVISDHIRALCFAIADGGIISNEGRGYVLRRILRRAARHGRLLDMHDPFLHKLVGTLVAKMGDHFPEVKSKQQHIELVLQSEEEQFGRTLDTGLEIFSDIVKKVESSGSKVIPGADVFRLYDTYGFPVDLTEVMAVERGLHADMDGFEKELEKQKARSRQESNFKAIAFDSLVIEKRKAGVEPFIGYKSEKSESEILGSMSTDSSYTIVLDQTPFYAESGGQIGDTGYIYSSDFKIRILDTQKLGNEIAHYGEIEKGDISEGYSGKVTAEINHDRRAAIKRNHTATHLLHKALRTILGEHVHQAGSLVAPDRLRFDFTHFKSLTSDEIDQIEEIVRQKITEDLKVSWENMPLDKAKKLGAMALFGEKYGDTVRVVRAGEYSMELCGGTHVDHTADIGDFVITQESAIAAGMRRIEAITGEKAKEYMKHQESVMFNLTEMMTRGAGNLSQEEASKFNDLFSNVDRRILKAKEILGVFEKFSSKVKAAQKDRQKQQAQKTAQEAAEIEPKAVIGNRRILIYVVPASNAGEVMIYSDKYRKSNSDSSIITISESAGSFAITSPQDGFAGEIMKTISSIEGIRGGGKPTVRGSMPPAQIDTVVKLLTEKFGA